MSRQSPSMRNDRANRIDFKEKLKMRIEMAKKGEVVEYAPVKKTNR
jgi:hypothetical protein